jgi:Xaa-Pro dipeptidase
MSPAALFNAHIDQLSANYEDAILSTGLGCDAVLLHSGSEADYYADDQAIPFRAHAHFLHWLPVNRPEQMVLFVPGEKPFYFQVVPQDFWYEQTIAMDSWWADSFQVHTFEQAAAVKTLLATRGRIAFLGQNTAFARAVGIDPSLCNPPSLLHWLDYQRAYKTPYEVAQLKAANRLALTGHAAAQQTFENGGSEYDIHQAFLVACNILETESPYTNIVGLNEKGAILHYQNKRRAAAGSNQVLLIDAGCRINNYCSDITRTHTLAQTPELFRALVTAMDGLQQELIQQILVGRPYLDLHVSAHEGICEILLQHEIVQGSYDELMNEAISSLFFPHGLGHLLGIQVHDVGGRQRNRQGDLLPPPAEYPALRNTRTIEPGQVFTIEPGLYFIPSLLDKERSSARGKSINWKLIEQMIPLGGIRIEDNVLVTAGGAQNLTRTG